MLKGIKILILIVFINITKSDIISQQDLCGQGCLQCNSDDNSNRLCSLCHKDFTIDPQSKKCIYNNCPKNLFLKNWKLNNQCVLICDDIQIGNTVSNTCESIQQCSTYSENQNLLVTDTLLKEAQYINEDLILATYEGYYMLINKETGMIYKTINFDESDIEVKIIDGIIFTMTNKNIVYKQDAILEYKSQIYQFEINTVYQKSSLVLIANYIFTLAIVDLNSFNINFYPLYSFLLNSNLLVQKKFNYNYNSFLYLGQNNSIIFLQKNQQIMLVQIMYSQISTNEVNLSFSQMIACEQYSSQNVISSFIDFGNQIEFLFALGFNKYPIFYANFQTNICKIINSLNNNSQFYQLKLYNIINQQYTLFLRDSSSIIILSCKNFEKIGEIKSNQENNEIITYFEILSNDKVSIQIVLLENNNKLKYYKFTNTFQLNLLNIDDKIIAGSQSIFMIYQNYNSKLVNSVQQSFLLYSQQGIQIYQQNKDLSIKNYRITKYSPPIQINPSPVNQMIIIEDISLLITCIQEGYIIIYDISSGFAAQILLTFSFENNKCFKIDNILSLYLLALLSNKIVIIDLFKGDILKEFPIQSDISPMNNISANGKYSILNYNNCIEIYENEKFNNNIFKNCDAFISQQNFNIKLLPDFIILLQKEKSLIQIKMTNNKEYEIYKQFPFDNNIKFFDFILTTTQSIDFSYQIEQLISYDQSEQFIILKQDFTILNQIKVSGFSDVTSIRRTKDDSSVYFMIKCEIIEEKAKNTIIAIKIGNPSTIVWEQIGFEYSVTIDEPKVMISKSGIKYYNVRQYLLLGFYTVIKNFAFSIDPKSNYVIGHEYAMNSIITQEVNIKDISDPRYMHYIGSTIGTIQMQQIQFERYKVLDVKKYFESPDNTIQTIIQSTKLNKYFILTKYSILVFNVHTDILEDKIILQEILQIANFQVIEQLSGIIYISQSILNLVIYSGSIQQSKFSFTVMKKLQQVIYQSTDNTFLVLGDGLFKLDSQLNIKEKLIQQDEQQLKVCLITDFIIYCQLNIQQVLIFDLNNKKITQIFQIQGFQSNKFYLKLDIEYNRLFLIENYLQVFNLNGMFQQSLKFSIDKIRKVEITDDYYIISIFYKLVVLNRKDLTLFDEFESIAGFLIIDFIYISYMKQIAYYCDNTIFSQAFVLDIITKSIIGRLQQVFMQNGSGVVANAVYDDKQTLLSIIDEYGNFSSIFLFASYSVQGNLKIFEIAEGSEKPQGFAFDRTTNDILVYCKQSVYKIHYGLVSDRYIASSTIQNNRFTKINDLQNNELNRKFLVVGKDNYLYRYEDNSLLYEHTFNEECIGIRYLSNQKILLILYRKYFEIYDSYEYGNLNSLKNVKQSPQYLLQKIIDDDLFITFDKQLIHYDFLNNKEIKSIQFSKLSLITCIYINPILGVIILGFNDGDILIYNKNEKQEKQLSPFKQINQTEKKKQIKFIIEKSSQIVIICNIRSYFIEINLQNYQVSDPILIQNYINELKGKFLLINCLVYDNNNDRLIFQYFTYKYGYVWNLKMNRIDGYVNSGNNQLNSIILSHDYIISYSTYQINLFLRNGEIKYENSVILESFFSEILNVIVLNKNILFVSTLDKVAVVYISERESYVMNQKLANNPFIIDFNYNSQLNSYRIIGLGDKGLFEFNINNLTSQNKDALICGKIIDNIKPQYIQQEVQMVEQAKKELRNPNGIQVVNQKNAINNYYVDLDCNYLPFLNQILLIKGVDLYQTVILSPEKYLSEKFLINSKIFQNLEQVSINLKNTNLQFEDQTSDINFNEKTLYFYSQNMIIQNINKLNGFRFRFQNLKEIIFFDLKIQQNTNQEASRKQDQINDYLFVFENIERIYIYNLTLVNNQFSPQNKKYFFYFKNITNITIQDTLISNNNDIKQIFKFELVENLIIDSFEIKNNIQQSQEYLNLFNINACKKVTIKSTNFQENKGYSFLQISNLLAQTSHTIILAEDEFILESSKITENKNFNNTILSIQSSNIQINQTNFIKNEGNVNFLKANKIIMKDSLFSKNVGQNGGAFSIYQLLNNLEIFNTTIENNESQGSGGGIYFEDIFTENISFDEKSIITQNKALIGGGIRIVNKQEVTKLPSDYPFSDIITKNTAEIYGDNSSTFITGIKIQNSQFFTDEEIIKNPFYHLNEYQFLYYDQNQLKDKLEIKNQGFNGYLNISNYKSGGNIYLNFYLIDDDQRKLTFSKEKLLKSIYPIEIINEIKFYSILISSEENGIQFAGQTILNYNVYNDTLFCFQIQELQISAQPFKNKQSQIISQINKHSSQSLNVYVAIEFRKCMQGEVIFDVSSNIQLCQFCSDGSYSLIDPDTLYNQQKQNKSSESNNMLNLCKKCPDSAFLCLGNQIFIYNGYWRQNNLTDEILACNNQYKSCVAEQTNNTNNICAVGYIGPLCEDCDTQGFNNTAGKLIRYVSSMYSKECRECSSIILQVGFFILQTIIIVAYLVLNTFKFIQNYISIQQINYLRTLQIIPFSKPPQSLQSTSQIKILLSFLQFTSLLITQPSLLPIEINVVPNVLGSSNKMITLSISCLIPAKLFQTYGKAIIYSIINLCLPFSFLMISLFTLQFIQSDSIKGRNYKKFYIYVILQLGYMFFLLDFVQYFTQMLTCRQIGSNRYHTIDQLTLCDDYKVQKVMIPYSAVLLVLWIIFPLFQANQLRKSSKKLDYCQTKFRYGYFYLELNKKFYFWEFIRLYVKIFVVVIFTLLRSYNIMIARQIVIVIFSAYIRMVQVKQPLISKNLNNMELSCYKMLIIKILLSSLKDEQGFIIWDLGIYACDLIFFTSTIIQILKAILNNKQSLAYKLINQLTSRFCQKYFKLLNVKEASIMSYLRWKQIRKNLRGIIRQYSQITNEIFQDKNQKSIILENLIQFTYSPNHATNYQNIQQSSQFPISPSLKSTNRNTNNQQSQVNMTSQIITSRQSNNNLIKKKTQFRLSQD